MTKFNFKNKNILVTGGTGLIGRPLVRLLSARGACVRVAALDIPESPQPGVEYIQTDLTRLESCMKVCSGMDVVFHLAGVKGSPLMTKTRPASFFVPMLMFNTGMMEAARRNGVERYLFTSTVGVYAPSEVFKEDDVWASAPSANDRFAGWAKRMGELQAEAYKIEHGWDRVSIVRPANVYGPHDNFNGSSAMVIPSLIKRAVAGENPFSVWGDGSAVRDFIYASDVAEGMMLAVETGTHQPINLASGTGVSIKKLVEIITGNMGTKPEIVWDTSKPSGDKKRVMDISRARAMGFSPKVSIEDGIHRTMAWYRQTLSPRDKICRAMEQ